MVIDREFHLFIVRDGNGKIISENQILNLEKEETKYTLKGIDYRIEGNIELLKSYV